MTATTCPKCGSQRIVSAIGVIGFPGYHVAGSRREWCNQCDEPPTQTLHSPHGPLELVIVHKTHDQGNAT